MQLTEKSRNEIALTIGKLAVAEAEQIKTKLKCSMDTVYRAWRKLRTPDAIINLNTDEVMVEFLELAATRKVVADSLNKRIKKSMRQLSAKPRKQAA